MKKLMKLFDHMDQQLKSAECFAKCAIEMKSKDEQLANEFVSLARTEIDTYDKLNNMALRHIKKHFDHDELPEGMEDACDYIKRRSAEDLAKVQLMIDHYNK